MPQNMDHECGECKTDHSSQPSAQVKNVWWFTPFPPLTMWVQKHTDSFTFAVSSCFLTLR